MVVLLITSLALMQTALVSISSNMHNVLRDEAASIAEMRMNDARSTPFAQLVPDSDNMTYSDHTTQVPSSKCPAQFTGSPNNFGTRGVYIERNMKKIVNFGFCTHSAVTTMSDGNTKQVTVTVGWIWKGTGYIHTSTTMVTSQPQ